MIFDQQGFVCEEIVVATMAEALLPGAEVINRERPDGAVLTEHGVCGVEITNYAPRHRVEWEKFAADLDKQLTDSWMSQLDRFDQSVGAWVTYRTDQDQIGPRIKSKEKLVGAILDLICDVGSQLEPDQQVTVVPVAQGKKLRRRDTRELAYEVDGSSGLCECVNNVRLYKSPHGTVLGPHARQSVAMVGFSSGEFEALLAKKIERYSEYVKNLKHAYPDRDVAVLLAVSTASSYLASRVPLGPAQTQAVKSLASMCEIAGSHYDGVYLVHEPLERGGSLDVQPVLAWTGFQTSAS